MPLKNRTTNPRVTAQLPPEQVKMEQPQQVESDSSMLEDNREVVEGRWNEDENFKFVMFVVYYQDIFISRHRRKVTKIFKTFAEFLTDRSASQCRSHYQKMALKYKTPAKMKKHYKKMFGEEHFNAQYEIFKAKWQQTHPPQPRKSPEIRQFKDEGVQTEQEHEEPHMCNSCRYVNASTMINFHLGEVNPFLFWQNLQAMQFYQGFNPFFGGSWNEEVKHGHL